MDGAAAVISNGESTFYIKTNGELWASGLNDQGQLGAGHREDVYIPRFIMTAVQAVTFDPFKDRVLILRTDGSLWSCSEAPCRLNP